MVWLKWVVAAPKGSPELEVAWDYACLNGMTWTTSCSFQECHSKRWRCVFVPIAPTGGYAATDAPNVVADLSETLSAMRSNPVSGDVYPEGPSGYRYLDVNDAIDCDGSCDPDLYDDDYDWMQ
jgi:hypothetical protein